MMASTPLADGQFLDMDSEGELKGRLSREPFRRDSCVGLCHGLIRRAAARLAWKTGFCHRVIDLDDIEDYLMAKGVCDDAVERMQMLLMHIRRALSRKRYVR